MSEAQQRLGGPAGIGMPRFTHTRRVGTDIDATVDDALSDDMDPVHSFNLPTPELGNLTEIENGMRMANSTAAGRDSLAKFAVQQDYVTKLVPLVEMAEDLESLGDLHRLCNIMKTLILLNDSAIIEYAVTDQVVLGVVGALECEYTKWGGTLELADDVQTTRTFQATKRTTDGICQTNRGSRKL